ncbi:Uncharacterised protein [Chlamydia trachomatis]|nr:Uncharacterised protein [Chlamydia trachomatis]
MLKPETRSTSLALKTITLLSTVLFTSVGVLEGSPEPKSLSIVTAICAAAGCKAVSTPRSNLRDASVGSLCLRAVRAIETGSKCAASTRIFFVSLVTSP